MYYVGKDDVSLIHDQEPEEQLAQYAKRSFEKRTTISVVVSPVVENYLRTVSKALDKSMSSVAAEILEAAVTTNRPTKKAS